MTLVELAERVPDCILAAWVDARTGATLERHARRDDAEIDRMLDVVIEIVRSPERPAHTVLLAPRQVFIARRAAGDRHRVIVVVCERSPNLGLAVALVRSAAEAARGAGRAALEEEGAA